ncbi:amidase family protein, partial [Frankia gtarii]
MTTRVLHDYPAFGATELAALVSAGLIAPSAPVEAALARLRQTDGVLRAFTACWPAWAAHRAGVVGRALARGAQLPLAGVPIAVKAGSGVTAPTTRRLLAAGAIVIGTTAVPVAAAHPWQTWGHTARGPTANPWRPDRVPGGSSAGSAVAVASGVVPLATAGDGAGSTRIPAAWCGVVGLKPTSGRFPGPDRAGLTVPGPIVRRAVDAAAWWAVVAGARELPPALPPEGGPAGEG